MSYTSSDPEKSNRDPDTSSLPSTSTTATPTQLSKSSKKPWSKFKSTVKSLGRKMSSKPTFAEPTESSARKKTKKTKRIKESASTSEVNPSPSEEKPREKSPSKGAKGLIKKLSVETISTPFVGYQPSSVSPNRSDAKVLNKSAGSTSESNLSASDLDSPKKSLTLDKNTKYMMSSQDSPDSGRDSRMMESSTSLGDSRPPSQITGSATSDLSIDSDYTTPDRSGAKVPVKEGSLVAKTAHFAQSVVSPKPAKESGANVIADFIKAEAVTKEPEPQKEGSEKPKKKEIEPHKQSTSTENKTIKAEAVTKQPEPQKQGTDKPKKKEIDPQKQSTPTENKTIKAEAVTKQAEPLKEGTEKSKNTEVDPQKQSAPAENKTKNVSEIASTAKRLESDRNSSDKKDTTTSSFIKSEQSVSIKDPNAKQESTKTPPSTLSEKEKLDKKIPENEKPKGKPEQQTKTDETQNEVKIESKIIEKKEDAKPKVDTTKDTSNIVEPKTKVPQTEEKKDKSIQDTKGSTLNGEKENTKTAKNENLPKTDESRKPPSTEKTPEKAPTSKKPSVTPEVTALQSDFGPSSPPESQKTPQMTVEEKLEAFLSAEGAIKDISDKSNVEGSHQSDRRECLYKILVIGELGTGKTSIIKRYVHQFFSQHYRATIGVDFALKVLNWDSNTIIRLQLWDIAGQERFGNMTRVYYKEAVGAFIVFDVTRSATFDAVLKWKQDLDSKVQLADGSPIPCVLLANKCDQQKEGIVNTPSKMEEFCKENSFSAWFETSAKENVNIDEAAKCLVTQILQNDKVSQNGKETAKDGTFPLGKSGEEQGRSCAC